MEISCNNFKMQKIVEGNCKTLCIKEFLFFFVFVFFVMSIYLIYLLFKILYNLYFLLNPLENNLGAAIGSLQKNKITSSCYWKDGVIKP